MHRRWFVSIIICMALPAFAYSATYYVAKAGSNNYSCAQVQSPYTPKLTIAAGIACLSGGDTLVIQTGTYLETITGSMIPSGLSTSQTTRIIGDGGAKWTIKPPSQTACSNNYDAVIRLTNRNYIEISDFIIDGRYGGAYACPNGMVLKTASDNYIHDGEIHHTASVAGFGSGILFASNTSNRNHVDNLTVHDVGADFTAHCQYYSGDDNIIENTVSYNCYGHGIHLYDVSGTSNDRNIIRWNYIHDAGAFGIGLYRGVGNEVYGNTIESSGAGFGEGGIRIDHQTTTTKIYNNTIYSAAGYCLYVSLSSDVTLRNNACVLDGNNTINDGGTATVVDHNLFTANATVFRDAANHDFTPSAGSQLIDAGTMLGLPSGISYKGVAPDQGAIEAPINDPPLAPPNAPTGVTVSAVSRKQIKVGWQDNSTDEDSFVVTTVGVTPPSVVTTVVGANQTSVLVRTLKKNKDFCSTVVAVRGGVESTRSNEACARTY